MQTLHNFFTQSIEYREWGMNVTTATACNIVAFMLFQAATGVSQARTIVTEKKAEKVSLPFNAYIAFYCLSLMRYGYANGAGQRSLALMSMGILGVLFVVVFLLIARYGEGTSVAGKIMIGVCMAFPFMMWFGANRERMLAIQVFTGSLFIADQTYQCYHMWREKRLGNFRAPVTAVFFVSCVNWFFFALYTGNTVLSISNPVQATLLGTSLVLWYKTRRYVAKQKRLVPA